MPILRAATAIITQYHFPVSARRRIAHRGESSHRNSGSLPYVFFAYAISFFNSSERKTSETKHFSEISRRSASKSSLTPPTSCRLPYPTDEAYILHPKPDRSPKPPRVRRENIDLHPKKAFRKNRLKGKLSFVFTKAVQTQLFGDCLFHRKK